jgi:hypothetical protein
MKNRWGPQCLGGASKISSSMLYCKYKSQRSATLRQTITALYGFSHAPRATTIWNNNGYNVARAIIIRSDNDFYKPIAVTIKSNKFVPQFELLGDNAKRTAERYRCYAITLVLAVSCTSKCMLWKILPYTNILSTPPQAPQVRAVASKVSPGPAIPPENDRRSPPQVQAEYKAAEGEIITEEEGILAPRPRPSPTQTKEHNPKNR